MKSKYSFFILILLMIPTSIFCQNLVINVLKQPVEIYKDPWGISHIYAQNEHDLFVAQGYTAASDRLFQLEMWRRQATGTMADLLGEKELKRDIGTRLFKFRGNLDKELKHYHPLGKQIVEAFVAGINAYITEVLKNPNDLPFEFKLLNTLPGYWTTDVVISRHQGLLGNVVEELNNARIVKIIGAEKFRELSWFHPKKSEYEPNLFLDNLVDNETLFSNILELYQAFRAPLRFPKKDDKLGSIEEFNKWYNEEKQYVGSNNWIVSSILSQSGYPMLANDPHRSQTTPSLRYWIHLNAPGWNVIGGGEPTLPGVSIGHNDYGAWGLTIFETDNEDLYVYEINPKNPNQYKYEGRWENIKIIFDTIKIKDRLPEVVELKYTRHGPIVFQDINSSRLYAVKAGWQENGCAPYMASLRMNQSKSWKEFKVACTYSRIPGENMIWADKAGHIGWQATGLSPKRKNWSGLLPIPGDGRYEWDGYLPIELLPNVTDPKQGYFITANNNMTPNDFKHRNAIGWTWSHPARAHRIEEVLASGKKHTLSDFAQLQNDHVSLTARSLIPLLKRTTIDPKYQNLKQLLENWESFALDIESIEATLYTEWEKVLKTKLIQIAFPQKSRKYLNTIPTKIMTDWMVSPPPFFGVNPVFARDTFLTNSLMEAIESIKGRLGEETAKWKYGQEKNKHIYVTHSLSKWVEDPILLEKINLGPIPRGGSGETVNNTSNNLNQSHGASFKIIVDTENWDRTLGINSPGQSGDPRSKHYGDLFNLWGTGGYFPVYFSKSKVLEVAQHKLVLKP